MKKFVYILALLLSVFHLSTLQAQKLDSLSMQQRLHASTSVMEDNFSLGYENPAMMHEYKAYTLNELRLYADWENQSPAMNPQLGTGRIKGALDITAFVRHERSTAWGVARYKNGLETGRYFNETSDYQLLYPYVMADTLGGDMYSEEYYFMGGYAYRKNFYTIGIQGSYRAVIEYRNVDPRPKNLVGELDLRFGFNLRVNAQYGLGASIFYRKYKQTNELDFYDELGKPNVFHTTGLGTHYNRFKGANMNTFYNGFAAGGSIDLMPIWARTKGFTLAARYDYFGFEKVIVDLNELPLAEVAEHRAQAELGYRSAPDVLKKEKWGIHLHADYVNRMGTENIFGDAASNVYPKVGEQTKYENQLFGLELGGVYEHCFDNHILIGLVPTFNYLGVYTEYSYPHRHLHANLMSGGVELRTTFPAKKWLIRPTIGFRYKNSFANDLQVGTPRDREEYWLVQPVHDQFNSMTAEQWDIHATFRADFTWNKKFGCYLFADYTYSLNACPIIVHDLTAGLGFSF